MQVVDLPVHAIEPAAWNPNEMYVAMRCMLASHKGCRSGRHRARRRCLGRTGCRACCERSGFGGRKRGRGVTAMGGRDRRRARWMGCVRE